jgi:outer membrane lipoprotein carrier protein
MIRKFSVNGWFPWLLLLPLLLPAAAMGAPPSLDELASKVQRKYDQAEDLKARFVQVATFKTMGRTIREEGTVYFRKPKRMLWEYTVPSEKKLVVNPQDAWLYLPEDGVAYLQPTDSLLKGKMTIRFLTGLGTLREEFDLSRPPGGAVDEKGNYVMDLKPKNPELGITVLTMAVDRNTFLVTGFRFSDIYGNRTELVFEDMAVNTGLPDDLFTFTPPPGTEIYRVP